MNPAAPRTIVEACLPNGRQPGRDEVGLDVVFDVAAAAGVGEQPVRLAIRRMIAAGEIVQSGRGRGGTLRLTGEGLQRLDRDRIALRLAALQDAGEAPWDGRWQLIAISTPESERAIRDQLRRRLLESGAAAVSTGLYVSPHDLTDLLPTGGREHLVLAAADRLTVRGQQQPQVIAEMLWPATPLLRGYTELDALTGTVRKRVRGAGTDAARGLMITLAVALEQAIRPDPLIPAELRRGTWRPSRSRAAWRAAWNALQRQAPDAGLYPGWTL